MIHPKSEEGFQVKWPRVSRLKKGLIDLDHEVEVASNRGARFIYYPATVCSCTGKNGIAKLDCDCDGGYRYDDRGDKAESDFHYLLFSMDTMKVVEEKRGMITYGEGSIRLERRAYNHNWQHLPRKERYFDHPLWEKVHNGDIFAMIGQVRRQFDVLLKDKRDKIRNFNTERVVRIFQNDTRYYYNHDWIMDVTDPDNRTIAWVDGGNAPAADTYYTVEYIAALEWIVHDDVMDHEMGVTEMMGRDVTLKLRQFDDPMIRPDLVDKMGETNLGF